MKTLGFQQCQKKNWYGEECRFAEERKQTTYHATYDRPQYMIVGIETEREGSKTHSPKKRKIPKLVFTKSLRSWLTRVMFENSTPKRKYTATYRRFQDYSKLALQEFALVLGDLVTDTQSMTMNNTFQYPTMSTFEYRILA